MTPLPLACRVNTGVKALSTLYEHPGLSSAISSLEKRYMQESHFV